MTDNVDYNDLKRLIKARTTRGQGEALTIPGHSNEAKALQAFEDEFFTQLVDQHQRVDLFVRSKAGEINRRLVHLDKQIGQLQQRYAPHQTGKVSVRRLERYSKAEEAAEKAGEEIRSLARFVGAQKLAFVKLLKKYKKWTSSSGLEIRFRKKVLDRSNAFSKRDFEPLLTQYNDVLAAIRAPFEDGGNMSSQQGFTGGQAQLTNGSSRESYRTPEQRSIRSTTGGKKTANDATEHIQAVCQGGSNVDFDTALAILPLGKSGGKASYWIHLDNLVELHVLLVQYTRLRRTNSPKGAVSTANESRRQSRRESMNGTGSSLVDGGDDDAGLVICDDLQRFARRRSSAPISDTEEFSGVILEKAAATVRYTSSGQAVVAVSPSFSGTVESKFSGTFEQLKIKKKAVRYLFECGQSQSSADTVRREKDSEDSERLGHIQERLRRHPEIQPLVQLHCKRTRFVGLKNGETSAMWATLDKDVTMRRTLDDFFRTKEGDLGFGDSEDGSFINFPFALLEVRYEGGSATDFLTALDETHLSERIRGFSMETHAVATLCKPQGMPPPYWLPALDLDLRKLPATIKTVTSRKSSKYLSPESSTAGRASMSATSVGETPPSSGFSMPAAESPGTSVPGTPASVLKKLPNKKRRTCKDRPLRQQTATSRQPCYQGYWNEYDNGDENSDNEPFTIYIDPNQPTFPSISKAFAFLSSHAKASSKKVKLWLGSSDELGKQNSAPVDDGSPYFNHVATPEDDSDLDDSPTDPLLYHARQRQYSTFRDRPVVNHAFRARESLLARCCIAFFVASFVLLLVAALLASAGRRKAIFKVDIGVITGVVFSLVFAIAGVASMFKRRENVGTVPRMVVFTALAVVCVGGGILLAGVVGG